MHIPRMCKKVMPWDFCTTDWSKKHFTVITSLGCGRVSHCPSAVSPVCHLSGSMGATGFNYPYLVSHVLMIEDPRAMSSLSDVFLSIVDVGVTIQCACRNTQHGPPNKVVLSVVNCSYVFICLFTPHFVCLLKAEDSLVWNVFKPCPSDSCGMSSKWLLSCVPCSWSWVVRISLVACWCCMNYGLTCYICIDCQKKQLSWSVTNITDTSKTLTCGYQMLIVVFSTILVSWW